MPTWPASLPQHPDVTGYREQVGNQLLRTKMSVGPPKQRRRYTASVKRFPVRVTVDDTQLDTFRTFVDTDLQGGALRFDCPLTEKTGTVSVRMFPVSDDEMYTITPASDVPGLWEVEFRLEVLPA